MLLLPGVNTQRGEQKNIPLTFTSPSTPPPPLGSVYIRTYTLPRGGGVEGEVKVDALMS